MGAGGALKVLVTGADGQLGRSFRQISSGFERFDFSFAGRGDLDLANRRDTAAFFAEKPFDIVINCAAYTAVDLAETEREAAYIGNVTAVKHLVEACKKYAMRPVHYSTDYVFDGEKTRPYRETDAPNPINYYGYSKWLGEQVIQQSGIDFYLFRTAWLYSGYGKNFVKTLIQRARTQVELQVVNDQTGCLTAASWLAAQTLKALQWGLPFGLYHLCGGKAQTRYEIAREIAAGVNPQCCVKPIETKDLNPGAKRPKYSVLDTGKYDAFLHEHTRSRR